MPRIDEKFICKLEDVVKNTTLCGGSLQNALGFIAFLRKNDMIGKGTHGGVKIDNIEYQWAEPVPDDNDTIHSVEKYVVMGAWVEIFCKTTPICFLSFDLSFEATKDAAPWTFWPVGEYDTEYADIAKCEQTKMIARQNAKICTCCDNKCTAASQKVIFGETFDNVCIFHMEFNNPNAETLECIKNLMLMKKQMCR